MLGALIGAGASLLGGVLGNRASKKAHDKDTYNNSPQGIRANAEEAKFNPLLFVGPGTGTGAGYTPAFSNPLAGAGAILSDGYYQQEQLKIQKAELEQENQRLEMMAKKFSLTPPVPGLYGGRSGQNISKRGASTPDNGVSNVVLGKKISEDEGWSDAEKIEERYGDVLSSVYGVGVLTADAVKSARKYFDGLTKRKPERFSKAQGPYGPEPEATAIWRNRWDNARGLDSPKVWPKHWGGSIPRQISPTSAEKQKFAYRRGVLR